VAYVLIFTVGVGAVLGGVWLVKKLLKPKRSALHLQLDPAIVTFDVTEVGQMATRRVVMRNRDVKPVRITGFSVSGGPFALLDVPPLPAVLPPGERLEFRVRFQPSQACSCSGELRIVSDAPRGSLEVSIRARAVERPTAGGGAAQRGRLVQWPPYLLLEGSTDQPGMSSSVRGAALKRLEKGGGEP